jgi:hypothetical protein
MTRFSVNLNGTDGSIIQTVSLQTTITSKAGEKTVSPPQFFVEGWVVNANGGAAGMDVHQIGDGKRPISINTLFDKSVTVEVKFVVGAGLYKGQKITGLRGGPGSDPGVYDIFPGAKPTEVTWLGDPMKNTTYTVTLTLNDDGTWKYVDKTAGIDQTGKFSDLTKK